jgi:hypothetical protein
MSGRRFTWANSRRVPTYERLDRVLISTEWEQQYPLATVEALNREISDHTPLLLRLGEKSKAKKSAPFKFELGGLLKEGFSMWSRRFGGRRVEVLPQCKDGKIKSEG